MEARVMAFLTIISSAVVTAATLAVAVGAGYLLMRIMLAAIERMFRTEETAATETAATVVPFVARRESASSGDLRRAA
jgi:hypothetical protein